MSGEKFKYEFYASGYGTQQYSYNTREEALFEMKLDTENIAEEYDGEIRVYNENEIVVMSKDNGNEIATFRMLN